MSPADPNVEIVPLRGAREVNLPFHRAHSSGEHSTVSRCLVRGFEVYAPKGTKFSSIEENDIQDDILKIVTNKAVEHFTVSSLQNWLDGDGAIRLNGREEIHWKKDSLKILQF